MGYVGINFPTQALKNRFIGLMASGGVKHVSLDELLILLPAVVISVRARTSTCAQANADYPYWTSAEVDAVELVKPEQRYTYVVAAVTAHEQTQLSS